MPPGHNGHIGNYPTESAERASEGCPRQKQEDTKVEHQQCAGQAASGLPNTRALCLHPLCKLVVPHLGKVNDVIVPARSGLPGFIEAVVVLLRTVPLGNKLSFHHEVRAVETPQNWSRNRSKKSRKTLKACIIMLRLPMNCAAVKQIVTPPGTASPCDCLGSSVEGGVVLKVLLKEAP